MCRGLLHPQGLTPQLPSDSHGLSFIPVSHLSLKSRNIFHGAIQAPPQYPQGSKPHLGCEREDSKEGYWDGFIRSTLDPTCAVRAEHHCFEHSRETEFLQGVTRTVSTSAVLICIPASSLSLACLFSVRVVFTGTGALLLVVVMLECFRNRILLCSPSWPRIINSPVSTSQELR